MVLASQTPRQTNTWRARTNERRRPRSRRRLILLTGVLVIGAIATWAIFFRTPPEEIQGAQTADAATDSASPTAAEAPPPTASRSADAIRGVQRDDSQPSPTEAVLSMGGSDHLERSSTDLPAGRGAERAANPQRADPAAPSGGAARTSGADDSSGPSSGEESMSEAVRPSLPPSAGAGSAKGPPSDASGAASGVAPEPLSAAIALAERDPVTARQRLSVMVEDTRLSAAERAKARETVTAINRRIFFAPVVVPGDPLVRTYSVQPGDSLQKITRSQALAGDWRLIKRINGIADERRLKAGQVLKVVPGVFHAVIDKKSYRMDVFLEQAGSRTFIGSLPVGLGEFNSTPAGRFKVRQGSKLVNPAWTNPRTGQHYKADDPSNPIGEFWIGLRGIDRANEGVEGYGIHGTIDPGSIGGQLSMGCVRLAAPDIALVYELITEPDSVVEIRE